MIFFTSACDFPQKEQRVMRDDLAMAGKSGSDCPGVEGGKPPCAGPSGGGLHHQSLRLPRRNHDMVDDPVLLGLLGAHVIVPVRILVDLLLGLSGVAGGHLAPPPAPPPELPRRARSLGGPG